MSELIGFLLGLAVVVVIVFGALALFVGVIVNFMRAVWYALKAGWIYGGQLTDEQRDFRREYREWEERNR
jgi:hypothetical protein